MKKNILLALLILSFSVNAQFQNARLNNEWDASWVSVPDTETNSSGLFLFRKTINLDEIPNSFEIKVTADNRYKLFVNEKLVSIGPAWGDLKHWNYETVNIAPFLEKGENIISAQVWNEGELKAVAQFSYRTGFLLQGTSEETKILNTNDTWKCIEDKSFTPIRQRVAGYYAAEAGEKINMNLAVKGWKSLDFKDENWINAKPIFEQTARGMGFLSQNSWRLSPSVLPQMELTYQRLKSTRRANGVEIPGSFPEMKTSFTIPSNTTVEILMDQAFLTNAYPTLIFSGGRGGTIAINYAEALYDENRTKNNRNEIEGKTISGRVDTIFADGSEFQEFTTLSWRTYRFIQLNVTTKDDPIVIEDFYGTFTGYPFDMNAKIESGITEIDQIMDIGWRTARLCAVETYMDCPYYERLQYIGDGRIQMMISYYNSGDDRLAKNALNLWDNSRQQEGFTLSRYPDTQSQVITPYSLWHISALYDYMMYGTDRGFVKNKMLGTRQILNYFIDHIDEDGSLKNVPGWNFSDWVPEWRMGVAPASEDGSSAMMDLQLLLALQSAITLEHNEGKTEYAKFYENIASQLEKTIKKKYWDNTKGLFADTPQKDLFSQHTNSLAIIAGLASEDESYVIGMKMLEDHSLSQATIYFKYYLHSALSIAGFGDEYLDWLDIWRRNINLGLTTWGETSEVETTRSDCHAWGASPNIEFFRIILGIESDAPYFEKVLIKPNLGEIEQISGHMPHPKGKISVKYNQSNDGLTVEIVLPESITGSFIWNNKVHPLDGGLNKLVIY